MYFSPAFGWNSLYQLRSFGLMCHLKPVFSLFIFGLDDLSIDLSGVLGPYYYYIIVSSPFYQLILLYIFM